MSLHFGGITQPAPAGVVEGNFTSWAQVASFPIADTANLSTSSNAVAIDEVNGVILVHSAGDEWNVIDIGAASLTAVTTPDDPANFSWAEMSSVFGQYWVLRRAVAGGDRISIFKAGTIVDEFVEAPGTNTYVNPMVSWSGRYVVFPDIAVGQDEWNVIEGS